MIILGYIAFFFIGLLMGMIGGGGSILGVPILVYLMSYSAQDATGYSLFVVGLTSLIGAVSYLRKAEISAEALFQFAISSMITVYCMRHYVMPSIPEQFTVLGFMMKKNAVIMILFALLILSSSISMIRKRKRSHASQAKWDNFSRTPFGKPFVVLLGVVVGVITGFVGAGGGFIIVPVLMFFVRLNFKKAIGTSLCIIAINSLVGFAGNASTLSIDWMFLAFISAISIVGILLGSKVAGKIHTNKLKTGFGWFTLIVGLFVFLKETFSS